MTHRNHSGLAGLAGLAGLLLLCPTTSCTKPADTPGVAARPGLAWSSYAGRENYMVLLHNDKDGTRQAFCGLSLKPPQYAPKNMGVSTPPKGFQSASSSQQEGKESLRVWYREDQAKGFDGTAPVTVRVGTAEFTLGRGQVALVDASKPDVVARTLSGTLELAQIIRDVVRLKEIVAKHPDAKDWFQ